MGERYDVIVTVKDGVFPLVAAAEGKKRSGSDAAAYRLGRCARTRRSSLGNWQVEWARSSRSLQPKVSFCREAMAPVSISWQTSGGT